MIVHDLFPNMMKPLQILEIMSVASLLSAAPLAAQCTPVFSFSVYNDASISSDGSTIYGYTSTEDTSTLCSCVHSAYQAIAAVYDPNGTLLGDSEQSGFSASVSSLMDGVSGNYQSSGAGVAYCSCLQGYFGGGGTIYYVAVSCPTSISVAGTQSLPLSNAYPSQKTGVGIMATMQVSPGSLNGSAVVESVTNGTNYCIQNGTVIVPLNCSGNAVFKVGPGGYNSPSSVFGTNYSRAGNNQFLDQHTLTNPSDILAGQLPNYSCTQTCAQTYSACGKQLPQTFTINYGIQHTSINSTPVTQVTITKTQP